jgi:hypothetical protein
MMIGYGIAGDSKQPRAKRSFRGPVPRQSIQGSQKYLLCEVECVLFVGDPRPDVAIHPGNVPPIKGVESGGFHLCRSNQVLLVIIGVFGTTNPRRLDSVNRGHHYLPMSLSSEAPANSLSSTCKNAAIDEKMQSLELTLALTSPVTLNPRNERYRSAHCSHCRAGSSREFQAAEVRGAVGAGHDSKGHDTDQRPSIVCSITITRQPLRRRTRRRWLRDGDA